MMMNMKGSVDHVMEIDSKNELERLMKDDIGNRPFNGTNRQVKQCTWTVNALGLAYYR